MMMQQQRMESCLVILENQLSRTFVVVIVYIDTQQRQNNTIETRNNVVRETKVTDNMLLHMLEYFCIFRIGGVRSAGKAKASHL